MINNVVPLESIFAVAKGVKLINTIYKAPTILSNTNNIPWIRFSFLGLDFTVSDYFILINAHEIPIKKQPNKFHIILIYKWVKINLEILG